MRLTKLVSVPTNIFDDILEKPDKVLPTMKIKVTDIVYDTDGETDLDLPTEMTLIINDSLDIETDIVDIITDETGWCVQGYNYEIL